MLLDLPVFHQDDEVSVITKAGLKYTGKVSRQCIAPDVYQLKVIRDCKTGYSEVVFIPENSVECVVALMVNRTCG